MTRLLVLAVDGLDWPLLMAEHTAGRMPQLSRLLAPGVQARLAMPAQTAESAAARWASIACGTAPAQHGIAHDLIRRADGLRLAPPVAADLHALPLWQHAWQAGLGACVAGWPATAACRIPPQAGPGSMAVADDFQRPDACEQRAWPLSPAAVAPQAGRAWVRAARMHPVEVGGDMLSALLPAPVSVTTRQTLGGATATLLARWASVHNLGVHWCEQTEAPLVMLRLDGLPAWRRKAAACAEPGAANEAPWLAWLDLLLGRYAAPLQGGGHLMLLSDQGPARSGDNPGAGGAQGGILVSGPRLAEEPALQAWPATLPAQRVLPMALALLGLKAPEDSDGRALGDTPGGLATVSAPPLCDQDALAWLHAQGLAAVDLTALAQAAQAVHEATLQRLREPG